MQLMGFILILIVYFFSIQIFQIFDFWCLFMFLKNANWLINIFYLLNLDFYRSHFGSRFTRDHWSNWFFSALTSERICLELAVWHEKKQNAGRDGERWCSKPRDNESKARTSEPPKGRPAKRAKKASGEPRLTRKTVEAYRWRNNWKHRDHWGIVHFWLWKALVSIEGGRKYGSMRFWGTCLFVFSSFITHTCDVFLWIHGDLKIRKTSHLRKSFLHGTHEGRQKNWNKRTPSLSYRSENPRVRSKRRFLLYPHWSRASSWRQILAKKSGFWPRR